MYPYHQFIKNTLLCFNLTLLCLDNVLFLGFSVQSKANAQYFFLLVLAKIKRLRKNKWKNVSLNP